MPKRLLRPCKRKRRCNMCRHNNNKATSTRLKLYASLRSQYSRPSFIPAESKKRTTCPNLQLENLMPPPGPKLTPSRSIDWFSNNEALSLKLLDLLQKCPEHSQVLWRNHGHPKPSASMKVEAATQLAELVFDHLPKGERDVDFDGIAVSERIKQIRKRYYDLRRQNGLTDSKGQWRTCTSAEDSNGELARTTKRIFGTVLKKCPYFFKLVVLNGDADKCGMEVMSEASERAEKEGYHTGDNHDSGLAEGEDAFHRHHPLKPPEQTPKVSQILSEEPEATEPTPETDHELPLLSPSHDPSIFGDSFRILDEFTIADLQEILDKRIRIMSRLDPVYVTLRRKFKDKSLTDEQQASIKLQMSVRETLFLDKLREQMWSGSGYGEGQPAGSPLAGSAIPSSLKRRLPDENTDEEGESEVQELTPDHDRETTDGMPPLKKFTSRHGQMRHQYRMERKVLKLEVRRSKRDAKERDKERKHELAMMGLKIRLAKIENGSVGDTRSASQER